jgi:hypothetical protein
MTTQAMVSDVERAREGWFALTPVYCPIESAIHPAVDRIERRAIEWIDKFPVYADERGRARQVGTRAAEWACRIVPNAVEERLQVLAQWTYWAFMFDDRFCDDEGVKDRPGDFLHRSGPLLHLVTHPGHGTPVDGFDRAQQDMSHALQRLGATPTQLRRWYAGYLSWFLAVGWQMGHLQRGTMPTVNDYIRMRMYNVGGEPVVALFDFLGGYELGDSEYDAPAVQALSELMFFIGGVDNDLQSVGKEIHLDQNDINFVTVLMHGDGSSRVEAVRKAVAIRDRAMCRFLDLREQVTRHASSALHQYLDDLGHTIRGNLDWGAKTPRYTTADTGRTPTTGHDRYARFAERPSDALTVPLPYPATRWWWDAFPG